MFCTRSVSFLLITLFLLFTGACKKNSNIDMAPNVNASNDVILVHSSFTTLFNLLIKARLDTVLASQGHSVIDGAYVTYNSSTLEYIFVFYDVLSSDSIVRRGNVNMLLTGDIFLKGSSAGVYFHDYYQDRGRVSGADSITNLGTDQENRMVFSEIVANGSLVKAVGGGTILFDRTTTYLVPVSQLTTGIDIRFLEKSTLNGISSKSHPFSSSVRDTLTDAFSCPWLKSGVIDIHVDDAEVSDGIIDFMAKDGCTDVIWYYFGDASFKTRMNQFWLKN